MKDDFNAILAAFKIAASCISYSKIRNISIYDIQLDLGTRIKDIEKYSNEFALALKAKSKPIITTIPSQGIVRIEFLDDISYASSFYDEIPNIPKSNLSMYLGTAVNGSPIVSDFSKHPHTLIAGTTGSGKTTLLHILIANALRLNVKLSLIDMKNAEFSSYKQFKNVNIANDYKSSLDLLSFLYDEMEYRYKNTNKSFPYVLFIIDEFADLIMQDRNNKFYNLLCKLAQKSRAANIYCVIATQRPSINIMQGSIKANFPARISCQVATKTDSKIILDRNGAELLAGNGDAIIKNYNHDYQRFQIPFSTPKEICSRSI
jgi:DNA segregation ATPase FtsK/SpoIIIE, S-DNA-T family